MKENIVTIKIDGMPVKAKKGGTVLEAAIKNDIYIPNLCHSPQLDPWGACRLCMVENQEGRLITSCEARVEDGMEIVTESDEINRVRILVARLLIANHEMDCLTCAQDDHCQLQEVTSYLGIQKEDVNNLRRKVVEIHVDNSNPFFVRDLKKCVLCGICVRVCNEVLGVNAVDFGFRGHQTKITTFLDKPLLESNCVSCGECVVACPVGALVPKENFNPSREVKTVCSYCGVGCNIFLGLRGEKIVQVRGDPESAVNEGNLCVKGRYAHGFVNHHERLKSPLIKFDGEFKEVSWEEALEFAFEKLSKYNGDSFAALSSAKCTNEENYLLQKFTRTVMGTNSIDHCARLCHAPSVAGLSQTLGSGAMTNSIGEIPDSECILAIGTNTTESHPVIGLRVVEAVKNGAKLIVANPKDIGLVKHAHIFLQHKPGTDVALLMGVMRVIVDEKLLDDDFINNRCENFPEFEKSLEKFDLPQVVEITGVPEDKIVEAARLYAQSSPSSIFYSMGITQHAHGTDNVMAVSNLALLTGNIGKKSSGVNPLRGQNNVQGSCDMGALPNVFPGYQSVTQPNISGKFEKTWNSHLTLKSGLMLPEILESALNGEIKAMYIMGGNPLLSDPDLSQVEKSLENLDFLLVQDMFLTETAKLADLVLPACSFAEKEGTFTNTERRVQLIRQALNPRAESKPDWWIISQIAKKFVADGFDYSNPSEVFDEMASLTPIYQGLSHSRLEKGGISWPCRDAQDSGTPILYRDVFSTHNGKAQFRPLEYVPPAELPDKEYPLLLTTGRCLYQYHTRTMTGLVDGLNILYGQELMEINHKDARDLEIEDGSFVRVISRRGEVKTRVKISPSVPGGMVSMTFHFQEAPVNLLTNPVCDPVSKTPELKVCAVRVEPIKP